MPPPRVTIDNLPDKALPVGTERFVVQDAGVSKRVDLSNAKTYFTSDLIRRGAGTPEGVVTAPVGTLWLRTDGGANTTLYVKESGAGNTGWVAK